METGCEVRPLLPVEGLSAKRAGLEVATGGRIGPWGGAKRYSLCLRRRVLLLVGLLGKIGQGDN